MKPIFQMVFIWLLVFNLGGCATPSNIKEKSAASMELYKNVSIASQNLSYAINNELKIRDRYEHENAVRNGEAQPVFVIDPKKDENTEKVANAFKLIQMEFERARLLHGTVDRFLRIDVVDLDDVKKLSAKGAEVLSEHAD